MLSLRSPSSCPLPRPLALLVFSLNAALVLVRRTPPRATRPCPPRLSLLAAPILMRCALVRRAPPLSACPRLAPVLATARPCQKQRYVSRHHKIALRNRARTTYHGPSSSLPPAPPVAANLACTAGTVYFVRDAVSWDEKAEAEKTHPSQRAPDEMTVSPPLQ